MMNDLSLHVTSILLRTTLVLVAAAIAVRVLLWWARPHSPIIHRAAWGCVLLQGVLIFQWTMDIPWYEATVASAEPAAIELPDFRARRTGEPAPPSRPASPG